MLLRTAVLLGFVLLVEAPGLGAQGRGAPGYRLLRQASASESRGDLEAAEQQLRQLLELDPGSSGGLFALERVLRAKGETVEVLPLADAFLQGNPRSAGVRYLKLRVLAEADSVDALRREAESWLRVEPESEAPYREIARVWEDAFGPADAAALLRRGRTELERPDALALELGDLLVAAGDIGRGLSEWALAVGDAGEQQATVSRRLQAFEGDSREAGRTVVALLSESGVQGRRNSAVRITLELGLAEEGLELAQSVARDLEGRRREGFLSDTARRARDAGLSDIASWAYDELGQEAANPAERRRFDQRLLDVALATGDTASAIDAQLRIADTYVPGSPDQRRAMAQVIRLQSPDAPSEAVRRLLSDFLEAFPGAAEADELAARVSVLLQVQGDEEGAIAVLEGVEGPRSTLERAYLLLDAGAVEEARMALLQAMTTLAPSDATEVIQFTSLLARLSPAGAELMGRAGVEAHRGRVDEAVFLLEEGAGMLDAAEQPSLLAEAARIADRGGSAEAAARLRERILSEHPDALEVGESSIALARYHSRSPSGLERAIMILEDLIASRPNAAVVPAARAELERLRGLA